MALHHFTRADLFLSPDGTTTAVANANGVLDVCVPGG